MYRPDAPPPPPPPLAAGAHNGGKGRLAVVQEREDE
jgi:hypothetical protein